MREKEKSVKGWVDGVLPEGWNEIISFMRYNARVWDAAKRKQNNKTISSPERK